MTRNIGQSEQTLRLVSGVSLVAFALFADLQFGWALLLFLGSVALLTTSLLRYCPIKAAFGSA
jgi:hypothetical protein